ncbi:MAG: UMP kinase [Ruminococcaceae bacterium]|nr:UMP kinase [Oscillospiraceae bacterium]
MPTVYKRVLLKLSGEALAGDKHFGLDNESIVRYCTAIKECVDMGVQIGIVVGGGNYWRGRTSGDMDRIRADHIGMLATTMNALAVCDALENLGVPTRVQTAIAMTGIAEPFDRDAAVRHLEEGRVVIFGCGTGLPFFSTDTTASLRGAQIGADVILKGTMVDGVYDSDPKKNPNAVRYDELTFTEVLEKDLKVMDSTAASMCRESKIAIMVFNIEEDPQNLVRAMRGEKVGTIVKEA